MLCTHKLATAHAQHKEVSKLQAASSSKFQCQDNERTNINLSFRIITTEFLVFGRIVWQQFKGNVSNKLQMFRKIIQFWTGAWNCAWSLEPLAAWTNKSVRRHLYRFPIFAICCYKDACLIIGSKYETNYLIRRIQLACCTSLKRKHASNEPILQLIKHA